MKIYRKKTQQRHKKNKNKLKTQNIAWRKKKMLRCYCSQYQRDRLGFSLFQCRCYDEAKVLNIVQWQTNHLSRGPIKRWLDNTTILISIANLLADNKNDEMIRFYLCRELIYAENHSTALYNFYVIHWYHIYYIFGMNFKWNKEIKK